MKVLAALLSGELRSMTAWALGVAAYLLLIGAVYSALPDREQLAETYENFPQELREAFGGLEDLGTVKGFLRAEIGSYMAIVLGIFGVTMMTRHLAGAEETGRLDHLLARPVERTEYYWSALAGSAIVLAVVLLGGALGGVAGFALSGAPAKDLLGILGFMLEFLPITLIYLGLGALTGALFHKRAAATGLGVLAIFAFFVMDIAARLVEEVDWLEWVTPHGYQMRSDLFSGDLDVGYVLFSGAVAFGLSWLGAQLFERKDLYA